jgi:ketosteroid isomerase-like protein
MNMTDSLGKPATQAFKAVTIWKKVAEGSWECAVDVLSHLPAEKQ